MKHLQQFINSELLIAPGELRSLMALITPAVVGGRLSEAAKLLEGKGIELLATSTPWAPALRDYSQGDTQPGPDSTVVVVRMSGMLYSWDTAYLIDVLRELEVNPAVIGVVLSIDGPGGEATGVDVAASIVRNFSKPVATVVRGHMCSAHYWIGSSAHIVFAESDICSIGCVGVMTDFLSFKEYFAKLGIKEYEVYATGSDLKNREIRDLVDNDDEAPLRARLDKLNEIFCKAVAGNLGIAYDPESEIFRGRTFITAEAVANGMVARKGTLTEAIQWVYGTAVSDKTKE